MQYNLSRHAQQAHRGPRVPPRTDKPTNRQIIEAEDERGAERRGRERYREVAVERMRGREKEIGGKSTARSGRKNEDHMRARKRERKKKGDSR
jgi:hypothetical protein